MRDRFASWLRFLLAALIFSCGGDEKPADVRVRSSGMPDRILATVNGTVIGEMDLRHQLKRLKRRGHETEIPPVDRKNVLETVVRQELIRQRAIELGLNLDPEYLRKRRQMEVQIDALEREELSAAFFRREVAAKAVVSEAEARKYFAANETRIRAELHVWQILRRTEDEMEQVLREIQRGESFEVVARKQFPNLPNEIRKPWDLGYLRWKQVPESWWPVVYDLQPGEESPILRGPGNRFWLVKLIDRRDNSDATFEDVEPAIVDVLKNAKVEELREKIERDLREQAHIAYSKPQDG